MSLSKQSPTKRQSLLNYSDLTVIIPTLNEGKTIETLLGIITRTYKGINAIVADDGSTDLTQKVVRDFSAKNKRVSLLDRKNEKEKGLTASVIDAVKNTKTEFLIVIDGDLQHPPEKIGEMYLLLLEHGIVCAARKKVLVNWSIHRKAISFGATMLAKARLGRKVSDPLSGFFGARTELFKKVIEKNEAKFEKQGYKVFFELMKYAPKATSAYAETFYDFGLRKAGQSKINKKHAWLFFKGLLK